MDRPPVAWILSDAPYAGGAERYLEFLLRAAGPARLGLVAVENPGLVPWVGAMQEAGFTADRIPAGSTLYLDGQLPQMPAVRPSAMLFLRIRSSAKT